MKKSDNYFDIFLPQNIIANVSNDREYEKTKYSLNHYSFPYGIFSKKSILLYRRLKIYLELLEKHYND